MISFKEYVNAITENDEDNLIYSYQEGITEMDNRINVDKRQLALITYRDGSFPIGKVCVYKHKVFDEQETRIVISCASHDASININDIGYGGIAIKDCAIDSEKPITNLRLGFTDEKFYISKRVEPIEDEDKYAENFDNREHDKKRKREEIFLTAEEWSVDRILDEILYAVKNTWSSDYDGKSWEEYSEILFNEIKPALVLAINDSKEKWINYLKHWMDNYRKMCSNADISKDRKDIYIARCDLYQETINILENKKEKEEKLGK